MRTITLDQVGPVQHLDIPLPSDGGIVVLQASHGVGKSHTLSAVQSLISGEGKVPIQDGAEKAEVSGLGIRMCVAKSTRRYGELEVESLEGKFDLGDLLNPGVKDEKAADSKRIKSLISISGIKANESLFHPLFANADEFKKVVQVISTETPDLIEMAARIKRDIEAAARQNELLFEQKNAEATGLSSSIPHEIVEMELPTLESLEKELRTAQDDAAQIRTRRTVAIQSHEAHKRHEAELSNLSVVNLSEIVGRGHAAAIEVVDLERAIAELEKKLVATKSALAAATAKRDAARAEYQKANNESVRIEQLKKALAESLPPVPSDEEINSADLNVQVICKHIETVKQKEALRQTAGRVRSLITESEQAKLMGEHYRKKALEVDKVLSNAICRSGGPLYVDNGRLVLSTDRGVEKFSDLSDGEKAKVGIDFQVASMGNNSLMVLKQNVFEGLNESTRQAIADHARAKGVTIITAECSEDPQIKVSTL